MNSERYCRTAFGVIRKVSREEEKDGVDIEPEGFLKHASVPGEFLWASFENYVNKRRFVQEKARCCKILGLIQLNIELRRTQQAVLS